MENIYLYIFGIIGLGVIVLILSIFFKKISITKDGIKAETNDGMKQYKSMTDVYKSIESKIQLIIDQSVKTGFEICSIKYIDIIELEINYAKEQLDSLKNSFNSEFQSILTSTMRYKKNVKQQDEMILFTNILTIYFYIILNELTTSFKKNNWKNQSNTEFMDNIERKLGLFTNEWKRVANTYYPFGFSSIDAQKIVEMINIPIIKSIFNEIIKKIFIYCRNVKNESDLKIDKQKRELEEYIVKIFNDGEQKNDNTTKN